MSKKTAASSFFIMIILMLLCLASLLCIRPAYRALTRTISARVETFRTELESKTGLTFSYSSMSPSILTVFSIKGIVLESASSGTDLVKIRKIVLRYNLIKLLEKKRDEAFDSITIDGMTVDYDDAADRPTARRLYDILMKYTVSSDSTVFDPSQVSVNIPVDIYFKNITLRFKGFGSEASFFLKKASAVYDGKESILKIYAGGHAQAVVAGSRKVPASGNFTLYGTVRNGLEESSVTARFSGFNIGDFSFGRQNFLITYARKMFSVRTIQNSYPLALQCTYGIDSGKADLVFRTEDLSPSSFMKSRKNEELMKRIAPVNVTVDVHAAYDSHSGALSYDSTGSVHLPDQLVPGALDVAYRLSGDKNRISVKRLSCKGRDYDADIAASYEFRGMRLSGTAGLNRIVLSNGSVVSSELYFNPLDRGFVCFAPQLFLNNSTFTALQLKIIPRNDSVDYSFEVSDYSHADAEKPGHIQIDGSYITKTHYIQAGVNVSDLYLDSAARSSAFFLPSGSSSAVSALAGALSQYIFTGEFYVSSDLKSVSYNIPYALVADTKKDGQFLLMSLDGNESSLQVTQFDVIYGKNTVHASAEIDKAPDNTGAFFTLDVNAGTVPYHFTGSIMDNLITAAGDYGTNIQIARSPDGSFEGSLAMVNFPVVAAGSIFTVSTETGFAYTAQDGFAVNIARLETEDAGGKYRFAPKLILAGRISKYGAFFDSISYSDLYSSLTGTAQLIVNMNSGIFDSAHFDFVLNDQLSSENVTASADVTNPDDKELSGGNIMSNLYFNAQLSCKNFTLNRFVPEQSENNALTASVTATGTLDKPYISLNVDSAGMMVNGVLATASGSASLMENELSIDTMRLKYGGAEMQNIKAAFSTDTYEGQASADFTAGSKDMSLVVPLKFTVDDVYKKEGTSVPESLTATLSSPGATGTMLKQAFPFSVTLLYGGGEAALFSSDNLGLTGSISDGAVHLSVAEDKPFRFTADGRLEGNNLDIKIGGIYADLAVLFSHVPDKFFHLYNGTMKGSVQITGLQSDPEFTGALLVTNPDFSLPQVVPSHITTEQILVTLAHNEIDVPETILREHGENVHVKARIYFDRWAFDRAESSVWTEPGHVAPADLNVGVADFAGLTSINLNILFQDQILDVTGKVYVEDVKAKMRATEITSLLDAEPSGESSYYVRTDIDIIIGPHVNFIVDPVLRCVLVPDTTLNYKMDETEGFYAIKGDVGLKSGDIAYLNRNFYIKEGTVRFNDTDGRINPRITVRAETRERDEDGNEVRIILTANSQYLLDFNPLFTSIPAKSETEIRTLLGQIAVGDSTNVSSLLFAAGDYAVQSTVGRAFENKLRDLMNFDIFSVRTLVLQNTLKGLTGTLAPSKMTAGNFLDNSTVYMGKYFGSSIYVDALLHMTYDETRVDDKTTAQGLVFRPEFGLEFESPFANIRWNMAPNIDAMLNNTIVSSTSVTLSWKFSF